ncbi:hypothetical protein O181_025803 [Austropuccinia psidii MF-1]|uniref:CCHC-type domain-containing protein n=1 Tax=Austropuccinia psidii MF-1 TaxID=1389203 RepID=A0A9Q3CNL2_9BASI|nr:hypothetical protein [Austropuccinia psidii MF-1]
MVEQSTACSGRPFLRHYIPQPEEIMSSSNKNDISPVDISTLRISNDDSISQANRQAESLNRFSLIAERIQPQLLLDGSNFNSWSKAMTETWASCFFNDRSYFNIPDRNGDYRRNLALKKRFSKSSWSAITQQASQIFIPSDQSGDLVNHSIHVQAALDALQSQIGPLTTDNILPLVLFFSAPQLQEQITTALNTRKASNPSLDICANNILDIANQIQSKYIPESSTSLQISAMKGTKPDNNHQKDRSHPSNRQPRMNSPRSPMSEQSIQQQSPDWKKKWLTARHPCFYCGGIGHSSTNCPIKAKAEQVQSKRENQSSIASIGVVPALENGESLLDSGATHSVRESEQFD